jgi:beta-xylosidase
MGFVAVLPYESITIMDSSARDEQESRMEFSNPVYPSNFADPFILRADDGYFAYATNNEIGNLPVLRSADLVHWRPVGDAMPQLASWVQPGRNWAPEVLRLGGRFVAYYTASGREQGVQCVGRAVADSPTGPFVDDSDEPLLCDRAGGSIDASPFRDTDGSVYLYWKNDGNAVGADTYIYGAPLTGDGFLAGDPVPLIKQDAPWEGALVEGPVMWRHDGRYYLFYSGNAFDKAEYAVGYTICAGPLGPCRKAAENPILVSGGGAAGPGHCNVIAADGQDWMVYHAWNAGSIGAAPGRTMWLDRIDWVEDRPVVRGPSSYGR